MAGGFAGPPSPRLERLLELKGAPADVLEIGCGTGRNTAFLSKRGFQVVALDVALEPLRHIDAGCHRMAATADFTLPFRDLAFDVVVDIYAFTFIANKRLYMREVRRVLKPGGLFMVEFDGSPHVLTHAQLRRKLRSSLIEGLEVLELQEIYHAWGCIHDESRREVAALSALLARR